MANICDGLAGEVIGQLQHLRNDDIVKYGANTYLCTTQHTSSGTTLDETKFTLFVSGLEFEDSWSSSTLYQLGDIVTFGGYQLRCAKEQITMLFL